ncbi:MAG: xanthine dehydrogenase family protein molybdopterin-binding subunit [Planctomycetota bacterium]|nr:MAG: xanthine dehydrogenase family protein molybdopterin-binding subunit [Planctomycetota bacterium]
MATVEKQRQRKYRVLGTRPVRHDGVDKVTGRARYGADTHLPGMLYAAMLRSPHAHARIVSIDTSAAEAMPGVHAVVTREDFPDVSNRIVELGEGAVNLGHLSQNVMARNKVLYKGHAVAAVAADSIHIAREAAQRIRVEYEILPPVLDVLEAMSDDAPVLNEDVRTEEFGGGTGDRPTNVAKHFHYEKGDVEAGFARAAVIVEREFRTATVHQGYIEPHAATALWNPDGHVTIWTCTQGSFTARQQTAELLGLPVSRVRVIPTEIGGGFGGKISVYLEPVAALLAKKSGRPVKLVMDRSEVLEGTGPTPGSYIRVKMGADRDGRITAAEAYLAYEAGAFPGSPINPGCMCIFACYDVPNGRIDGYDVCVNKPRTNAYRAPGATNAAFAAETVIDEICEQLGMDPLEFRLKNAAVEGTRRIDGVTYSRIGMKETVEAILNSEHYRSELKGPNRGRGVASGFWFNVGLKSTVVATVNPDGTVSLVEGSTDIGGTRTSVAMQLAETLGIAAEDVQPLVADTDSVGYTDVTGGSRVTFSTGIAAIEAAKDIQRQMCERAALIWDCPVDQVRYEDGRVVGPDGQAFTFKELAALVPSTGEPIVGRGTSGKANQGGAFATEVVDVEVDPDTGKVQILRFTVAQDAGCAVHPSYVEGQMQGGVVQGIGWALNEEYIYDDQGRMLNNTFLDYRIPTCYDVPMIDTIIVEVPDPNHPYGVRGVGEVPIVPPPAAIANAIYRAVGVRMDRLPMSPPRVLEKILQSRAAAPAQ